MDDQETIKNNEERELALALHEGALRGDLATVKTALKNGAQVDCRNNVSPIILSIF